MRSADFLYAFVAFRFVYPFFMRYFHAPYVSTLATNCVLMAFCAAAILSTKRKKNSLPAALGRDVVVFLVLIAVSGVLNSSHWLVIAKSIIEVYCPGIALLLVISSGKVSDVDQVRLVRLCYALIILQIPVSLAQFVSGKYANLDSNSGTISSFDLGGTGINAVLASFLVSRCVAKLYRIGIRPKYLILAVGSMIPVVVGGARFGLILLPMVAVLGILAGNSSRSVRRPRRIFVASLLIVGLLTAAVIVVGFLVSRSAQLDSFLDFNVILDPTQRAAYDSYQKAGRISYFGIVLERLSGSWFRLAFGLGSDAVGQSRSLGLHTMWPDFMDIRLSSAITLFAGLGFLGLVYMFYFYVKGAVLAVLVNRTDNPSSLGIEALSFVPISVSCLVASFYTDVWSSQAGIVYWVLFAVIVNSYKSTLRQIGDRTAC